MALRNPQIRRSRPTAAGRGDLPGFSSPPMLDAPPREESGPLGKKITPRQADEVAPPTRASLGPSIRAARCLAFAPADQTRLRGYIDG
jgi:hypothetical protein